MTTVTNRLWPEDNHARYARHLSTCFASILAKESQGVSVKMPRWTNEHRTSHPGLATAFSLQPRVWSIGIAIKGDSQ
jgi:hypothetical protein